MNLIFVINLLFIFSLLIRFTYKLPKVYDTVKHTFKGHWNKFDHGDLA